MLNPKPLADERELSALQAEAARVRAELVVARRDLDQVRSEFDATHGALLVEANERLVIAVLQAEATAESAIGDLGALARAAQRDALTGALNRATMLDRIDAAIAMAQRRGTRFAVLFVDLDHFKQINDSLSHAAGDAVLQLVAHRLESVVRQSDAVSRHGGDEFLVLVVEVLQAADAALIASKMLAALAAPVTVLDHALTLSASIGIALYPEDGQDAETLIGLADAAMYRVKRRGGQAFEPHADADPSVDHSGAPVDRPSPLADVTNSPEHLPRRREAAEAPGDLLATLARELHVALAPIGLAASQLGRARNNATRFAQLQAVIERQTACLAMLAADLADRARGYAATGPVGNSGTATSGAPPRATAAGQPVPPLRNSADAR